MDKVWLLLLGFLVYGSGYTQNNVTFRLHGLNKEDGLIRIALYDSENNYKKEITDLKYSYSKENVVYGLLEIQLNIKPGKYAIAFLDDTNKDAKMNYSIIGIPQEGYAFSKIKDYGYSKPSFTESCIEIKESVNQEFKIYFNYF